MPRQTLFTSESVSMGHPDKVADQISDAILDAMLADDPYSRVACETLVCTGLVVVAGEVTTNTYVSIPDLVRETIRDIGYITGDMRFDADSAGVMVALNKQSNDIAMGVDREGAGDQGMMFGFACKDTPELMPLPIQMAHQLVEQQAHVRKESKIPGLRPDAKSQVTVEYDGDKPVRVDTVVLSTQHDPTWNERQGDLKKQITEHVLKPVLGQWWNSGIKIHVNPTGRFEIGGPHGDTGLTGRKIIVDTYGGGPPRRRSPARTRRRSIVPPRTWHATRQERVVAAGWRTAYPALYATASPIAAGGLRPARPTRKISKGIRGVWPEPKKIIETLQLRRPIYSATAARSRKPFEMSYYDRVKREHRGEKLAHFTWEKTDKADALKNAVK
jgi:S-adenosylmethionine synthetase